MNSFSRHYYRFGYLKSEHWSNLRISKLASVGAKCARCGICDTSNDVHHLKYRNLHDVKLCDLLVLCRNCHIEVHLHLDKISNGDFGLNSPRKEWNEFLKLWGGHPNNIPELRAIIIEMRSAGKISKKGIAPSKDQFKKSVICDLSQSEIRPFHLAAKCYNMTVGEWLISLGNERINSVLMGL